MNHKLLIIITFLIFFSLENSAQSVSPLLNNTVNTENLEPDSTISNPTDFDDSLDKLLRNWVLQRTISSDCDSEIVPLNITDSIYKLRLSQMPCLMEMPFNNNVRSFIELYTVRKRKQLEYMLGMSDYYFPIFERTLGANNLPLELKYLPIIESALNATIISRMGAAGLWQFMIATGRMYGLEINSLVDERLDPYKSTQAAAKFLKDLYSIYGDWHLVIAAYNCGPGNVNKAIRRSGGKRDYWAIYPYLPSETRGYVLARVNRAPLGTLRALYDNERGKSLTGLPLVHLGIALSLQGDKTRGAKAITEGFARTGDRPEYLGDYGTKLRDDALMIALVHERKLAKPEFDRRAISLGRELDARRNSGWLWLSTQEQVALARLGKALMVDQKKLVSGQWSIGGDAEAVAPVRLFGRSVDHAALARGLRFVPEGSPPLYASLDVAGIPRSAPAPDNRQIGIERRYYTTDGKEWKGGTLKEGEALIVRVGITANVAMPDALFTDLLPAGLEIENFNLGDAKQWAEVVVDGIAISDRGSAADVKHEEFRDDRYVAALKLDRGDTAKVFYLVRAVTPGTYTVPPSLVEDMYRPDIRGVGKASPSTITVVQP